jgi:hypothetical protein
VEVDSEFPNGEEVPEVEVDVEIAVKWFAGSWMSR